MFIHETQFVKCIILKNKKESQDTNTQCSEEPRNRYNGETEVDIFTVLVCFAPLQCVNTGQKAREEAKYWMTLILRGNNIKKQSVTFHIVIHCMVFIDSENIRINKMCISHQSAITPKRFNQRTSKGHKGTLTKQSEKTDEMGNESKRRI